MLSSPNSFYADEKVEHLYSISQPSMLYMHNDGPHYVTFHSHQSQPFSFLGAIRVVVISEEVLYIAIVFSSKCRQDLLTCGNRFSGLAVPHVMLNLLVQRHLLGKVQANTISRSIVLSYIFAHPLPL